MRYISQCLREVQRALDQGLDVRGYFHWSDVDTFEWMRGYDAHYGLYGFDPISMERKERPAASFLSQVAHQRHLHRESAEETVDLARDQTSAG